MRTKITHVEILEEKGFKLSQEDEKVVTEYLQREIELSYDESDLKIYNEAGSYIADLIDCR